MVRCSDWCVQLRPIIRPLIWLHYIKIIAHVTQVLSEASHPTTVFDSGLEHSERCKFYRTHVWWRAADMPEFHLNDIKRPCLTLRPIILSGPRACHF